MQSAINPKTGEVLFLVDNQWVKPTQTAVNPKTGENAYLVNNAWQVMPMPKAPQPTERTLGEALITDPLSSLLGGAGTAMGSPGQLGQLITGEKPTEEKPKGTIESLAQTLLPFGTDFTSMPGKVLDKLTPKMPTAEGVVSAATSPFQGIQPVGEELKAFGEREKSAGLKAAEKGREKAIQEAEGFLPEVGAAVGQTLKNPALLSNFIFEQIPNFAGTLGGGAVSREAVKAFFKDATEKTIGRVGVGGAVATGAAMQAGDIGSETYQTIYDRLVKEGTAPDQAHQIALEKGRMAAAQAGAISVASSFIPGGQALEKRFLTEAGKKAGFPGLVPAVGNVLGEMTQEGVEEGGGKLVSNIQAAQVFPDIDVMKGVGAATGLGALGGGMFGGISNIPSALSRTTPTEPAPPGAEPPAPSAVGVPPAGPSAPELEKQLEETPESVRLFELNKQLMDIDEAFKRPDLTADDFRNLNTLAGQIRSQIAQIESGQGVTGVTPKAPSVPPATLPKTLKIPIFFDEKPTGEIDDVSLDPNEFYFEDGEVYALGTKYDHPVDNLLNELPDSPAKQALADAAQKLLDENTKPKETPKATEVAPIDLKSEQAYRMKYAVESIDKGETALNARSVNPLAKELGIKPGATPEETLANVKQALGIEAAPESVGSKATEVLEENISPAQKEQDEYAKSVRTDDGQYSLKDIQEAVKKLQKDETDYPVNMKAFEDIPSQSLLAVAQKNGFVSINEAGSVFPAYDAKTVEQNKRAYDENPDSFDNQKARALEPLKNKEAAIKDIQESRKISREYAEKAYDHYVDFYTKRYDYLRDGKYDLWQELQDKHNKFEKRLQAVANKAKSKEDKTAANKSRQAEKKAAAAKAKEPVDTSAVTDLIEGRIKKVLGWTIYKRKVDPDFWYVQSPENHAANKIGPGDDVSTNLDTARSTIEQHINDAEYKARKAAEKVAEKPAEKKEEPKAEKKVVKEEKPVEAKKPSTALVPKLDEDWASYRQKPLTEKPYSMDQDVWERYQDLQNGKFAFEKVSFTGAHALARANAANKERKKVYEKAVKEFLSYPITAKAPTKNQPKLEIGLFGGVFPPPISKNIKPVKTLEDQKKALLGIAATKDDPRKMLEGVLVEPNKLVVTDGHRMAVYNTNTGVSEKVVLDKDGKKIDMQYPDYERVMGREKNAKSYGMVNATALGNYARGTRNAWKYISADKNVPFSIQLKNGDKPTPFNGRYIEDMANLFRQFGYEGFEILVDDGGALIAKSPDGKLSQIVMGTRNVDFLFQPFSVENNRPGTFKTAEEDAKFRKELGLSEESRTIDVEATEITEEQIMLLSDETSKLSKKEMDTLEQYYGFDKDSTDFFKMLREDVIKYVNKGANAVDVAIRDIIKKLQAGVLAVAMVFNPAYMSQQSAVVYPTEAVTQEVKATVPESAKAMSDSGKKAYATLFAALQPELQKNNKYFTVVDKPTSKVYVFNPDGSLMTESNVVLGKALGDTYVGKTDFAKNRITPAGLFKPKAEKGSATYDGKTVYTLGNVKEGWNAVFMHTVYLKESDAEARKKALATGENTRLSHGCINGPSDLMEKIDNDSMNESHVFIVPDNQAMTDAYIANNVSNEDLTRVTVTPVTEQVPAKQAAAVKAPEVVGREEKALEPKTKEQINRERQLAKLEKGEPTGTFYNNFEPDFTEADFNHSVDDVRKEKIKELATESRRLTKTVKQVAATGSDLTTQYEINRVLNAKKTLTEEIAAMKQPKTLPEDVIARAAKERAEFERTGGLDGLSPEAFAVLEKLYSKYPDILNGLKLSVRRTERRGVTGSFDPLNRIVTIYKKGISSIFGEVGSEKQAKTMRHEIAHTLEQMMNSDVKQVLVNAWANSLQKAIKRHEGDQVYQDYFNAVMDFIENPNEATYKKATDLMPDYSMYQYISPSEYWAVNAEPLLNAQLGGAWARFTKAVKGLWEAIKSVFGFDNRYAIHREFNRIMSGDQQRMNKTMLVDYLYQNAVSTKFINNIEEERSLIEDLNLSEVPEHEERSMKDMAVMGYRKMQEVGADFYSQPGKTATKTLINASDAITKQRIENVFFAAGIEKRDQERYQGQIRAADKDMVASIAVKNHIHSAHISTQVILRGGLEFSQKFGQFVAKSTPMSLANVVKLQYALKKKLGKDVALKIINAYFIAKRSRSIQNQFFNASADLRAAEESGDFAQMAEAQSQYNSVRIALDKVPYFFRDLNEDGKPRYETVYDDNGKAIDRLPILNDDAIDRAIGMENKHPELKKMMENWTSVNHNMLDMMAFSGRISKKSAEELKKVKDYVPWYRIMDDQEAIMDGKLMPAYPASIKRFKAGETDRDIDNVVESMIHNVVMMTRSTTKTYAVNRVISEYGQRYEEGPKKGKLMVFPTEGRDANGTRIASFMGGRRVVTNIPDDLVADGVIGLLSSPITFPLQNVLSSASNLFRRSITFTPWFQLKQAFYDAPTAAWVSGVRNPFKLWAGCFEGYVRGLRPDQSDPIVTILKNAGVGGYQSFHRSARKEREIELGLFEKSNYAKVLKAIDHFGDASDLSQRIAVYKRVLEESKSKTHPEGDAALALLQASDIIDFQKHGKGRMAQFLRTTVSFMQAYATQMDALAQAAVGGNLKGKPRMEAFKQFYKTGMMLAGVTALYVMAASADDDYWELDDETRVRNFYIPGSKKAFGHHILIPMSTSASFFFKSFPELIMNKLYKEGTKDELDMRRLGKALGKAAIDQLLGPSPVPSGAKPFIEIGFDHNFYTGGNVVPAGMKDLESAEQYTASTSELGHAVSALTGRALSPVQADHLVRGLFGSVGAMGMSFSNMVFGENRPEPELRQNPIYGGLFGPEVSRKNEELFYDLKDVATEKYKTYQKKIDDEKFDEAEAYYDKNEKLITAYDYVSTMETDLKEINKEIRRLGRSADKTLKSEERTKEINDLKKIKSEMLDDVIQFRKEAGL